MTSTPQEQEVSFRKWYGVPNEAILEIGRDYLNAMKGIFRYE